MKQKGASLLEFGILVGLVSVVAIGSVVTVGERVGVTFGGVSSTLSSTTFEARVEAGLDRYPPTCMEGTSGSDVFYNSAFNEFDCLEMFAGNDVLSFNRAGSFDVSPGLGNDNIFSGASADVTINYEGGNDTYELRSGTLSFESFGLDDVSIDGINVSGNWVTGLRFTTPNGIVEVSRAVERGFGGPQNYEFSGSVLSNFDVASMFVNNQHDVSDDTVYGTGISDTYTDNLGNDVVDLGYGDDVFVYMSGDDTYYPYSDEDVLVIPYNLADVAPRIWANQSHFYIVTPVGEIFIPDQYSRVDQSGPNVFFYEFQFNDVTLSWDEMRLETFAYNSTSGDDTLYGTAVDDVFDPGAGNDFVQGANGDDTYLYTSGNLYVKSRGNGIDVLDLRPAGLAQSDVTFSRGDKDGRITVTATGAVISVEKLNTSLAGSETPGVEEIIFTDGTMDEATMRAAMGFD